MDARIKLCKTGQVVVPCCPSVGSQLLPRERYAQADQLDLPERLPGNAGNLRMSDPRMAISGADASHVLQGVGGSAAIQIDPLSKSELVRLSSGKRIEV